MATPHQNSLNLLFSLSFAILRGNQNWSVLNFAIFFYSFFYVALASDLKGGKFDDCTSEILKSLETEDSSDSESGAVEENCWTTSKEKLLNVKLDIIDNNNQSIIIDVTKVSNFAILIFVCSIKFRKFSA